MCDSQLPKCPNLPLFPPLLTFNFPAGSRPGALCSDGRGVECPADGSGEARFATSLFGGSGTSWNRRGKVWGNQPGLLHQLFLLSHLWYTSFLLNKYNIYDVFIGFSALPILPGKTTFLVHLVTALTNLELDPTLRSVRTWKWKGFMKHFTKRSRQDDTHSEIWVSRKPYKKFNGKSLDRHESLISLKGFLRLECVCWIHIFQNTRIWWFFVERIKSGFLWPEPWMSCWVVAWDESLPNSF